ncbi:MAG: hypothetical protein WC107_05960 [Patescibacteria group bacterium]
MANKDDAIKLRKAKTQEQIIEQLKRTPIIEVTCNRVGVGRNSYYRWRRESKKFTEKCDRAIQEGCLLINDLAESTLITAMKEQNLTACMYWLNHRHDSYKNKLEVSGNLEIKQDKLSKEEEKNIRKALELASLITRDGGQDGK